MSQAFDLLAADYDDDHHDAVAAALIELVDPTPVDRRVADVACGTGAVALTLARSRSSADPAVLAVDVSAAMIAAGRARAERQAAPGAIDWRVADAVPLPCADRALDLVLCASSLHFLGGRALADWRRALRPGGRVGYSLPLASGFRASGRFASLVARDLPLPVTARDAADLAVASGLHAPVARVVRIGDRSVVLIVARTPGAAL
ncbi:class I SAM-dependent methyltransferase [Streptomyces sp. NBC_00510]